MKLSHNEIGIPICSFTAEELREGVTLVDAMVFMGLAKSKREARQFIKDGAVKLSYHPKGTISEG